MLHTILDQMDHLLKESALTEKQKKEFVALQVALSKELDALAKTDPEHAKSIADFATIATVEALREDRNLDFTKNVREHLLESLEGFEVTHPKLANVLSTFIMHLSSLGI